MPSLVLRYPCPVCLGVKLRRTPITSELSLDHCTRCGGVWFQRGQAALLNAQPPKVLWAAIKERQSAAAAPCHHCRVPKARIFSHCPGCGAEEKLECPKCKQAMSRINSGTHHLDVCRQCQSVWFDHHELAAIWHAEFRLAIHKHQGSHSAARNRLSAVPDAGVDILAETLYWSPDLLFHGTRAVVEVGDHVLSSGIVDVIGSAPEAGGALLEVAGSAAGGAVEVAGAIGEVAGEAAAGVLGVIVEIIAGLFG